LARAMTSSYRPRWLPREKGVVSTLLLLVAMAWTSTVFVFPIGQVSRTSAVPRFAQKAEEFEDDEDDEDFDDEEEDEEEEEVELKKYEEYAYDEAVPKAWYTNRKIDRHKVNMHIFDIYKRPKSFFPYKLQAGDTIRVYFLEPKPGFNVDRTDSMNRDITRPWPNINKEQMAEKYIDGILLRIKGDYHSRMMKIRSMIGSGANVVGYEWDFPMFSPMITKLQVLRRGFLGRQKSAMFMRMMVGKRNTIPEDKERTEMDKMFVTMRQEGRSDEIPEPDYPKAPWDTYPLPIWRQDQDDWKEEEYDPKLVDDSTDWERLVIGRYGKRRTRTNIYGYKTAKKGPTGAGK